MRLTVTFERRAPGVAETAAEVNPRLALSADRAAAPVRGGEAAATYELSPLRRGEGEIERIWARWRGPFGLVWKQIIADARRSSSRSPPTSAR